MNDMVRRSDSRRSRPLRLSRRLRRAASALPAWVVVVVVAGWLPTLARAQDLAPTAPLPAPTPGVPDEPKYWVGYLITAVLAGLVLLVSLKEAKRGHQD